MSNSLFKAVEEKHDSKNRVVFVCEDPQGFYVFKPATGLKTKHWNTRSNKSLVACFNRQISCGQPHGFFIPGEAPAVDENYSMEAKKAPGPKPIEQVKVEVPVADAPVINE
jgi:hypothetical protein